MPATSRLRFLLGGLAVICALAAVFPDIAVLPIRDEIGASRSPSAAVQAARYLFVAGMLTFGFLCATWIRFSNFVGAAARRLAALTPPSYWGLVLGLACLARLPVALILPREVLQSDSAWYYAAAVSLSKGDGLSIGGHATAYRPPIYPALLSVAFRLLGPDPSLSWVWGIASTIAIILATHAIARRLYGSEVANLAALAAAVYPALALLTGQTLSDLLFVAELLMLVEFVLVCAPWRPTSALTVGVLVGIMTLTRGVALGLFLMGPIVWFVRKKEVRQIVLAGIVLVAGLVGTLAPWLWRNERVLGVPTLGTNLGLNLYIGNHAGAPGGYVAASAPQVVPQGQSPLNEADIDQAYLREALDFIGSHPAEAALLIPRKMFHLYTLEVSAAESLFQSEQFYPGWEKYGLMGLTQIAYLAIAALFCLRILDIVSGGRGPRGVQWIGWFVIAYFTIVSMVFFGQDRFRLPILPFMLIEGAVVLHRLAHSSDRSASAREP